MVKIKIHVHLYLITCRKYSSLYKMFLEYLFEWFIICMSILCNITIIMASIVQGSTIK